MGNNVVRVYFKSEIMDDPKFSKAFSNHKGQSSVQYRFADLPLNFYDGQFSMDAVDGEVPHVLREFTSGKYSLNSIWYDGFRLGGMYRDERFPDATADVKQCSPARTGDRSTSYNVDITGTNLQHILGLFNAIKADELVPVSVAKSAPARIAELEQALADSKQARLDAAAYDEAIVDRLQAENSDLEANLQALQGDYNVLRTKLAQATKPWYKKLDDWL